MGVFTWLQPCKGGDVLNTSERFTPDTQANGTSSLSQPFNEWSRRLISFQVFIAGSGAVIAAVEVLCSKENVCAKV
jgi:hypothetical protein